MTSIDLNPPKVQVLTTEKFPFTVEWQDLVGTGNTITIPIGVIYDNSNNVQIANGFDNSFGANGTQAQYTLLGPNLRIGHSYTAILSCISLGQTFKARLKVEVPS